MKKIILGLAAVALTSLLSSCLQNFKDNKLIIENATSRNIRVDFQAQGYGVGPGQIDTINGIESNKWPFGFSCDVGAKEEITISNNAQMLDFSSKGTLIRVYVTENRVAEEKEKTVKNPDGTSVTTTETVYKTVISANSTSGWTEGLTD